MSTEPLEEQALIKQVSKDLVTQLAPEELDLFEELTREYFHNPTPPQPSVSSPTDNPLGFGLGETLLAVTPAVTAAVSAAVSFITSEVMKSAKNETAEMVKKNVKELFSPGQAKSEQTPPLSEAQLEQVKRLARQQARRFGLDARRAENLANALVGKLALSN